MENTKIAPFKFKTRLIELYKTDFNNKDAVNVFHGWTKRDLAASLKLFKTRICKINKRK